MAITAHLARFAAEFRYRDAPEDLHDRMKMALLDALGIMLGAAHFARANGHRELIDYLDATAPPGPCAVVGHGLRTTPMMAAFANGTLSEVLDCMDCNLTARIHNGAAVTPAVLAVAEAHEASGSRRARRHAGGIRDRDTPGARHPARSLALRIPDHRHVQHLRVGRGGRSAARTRLRRDGGKRSAHRASSCRSPTGTWSSGDTASSRSMAASPPCAASRRPSWLGPATAPGRWKESRRGITRPCGSSATPIPISTAPSRVSARPGPRGSSPSSRTPSDC